MAFPSNFYHCSILKSNCSWQCYDCNPAEKIRNLEEDSIIFLKNCMIAYLKYLSGSSSLPLWLFLISINLTMDTDCSGGGGKPLVFFKTTRMNTT